jgi:threonine dehydratase
LCRVLATVDDRPGGLVKLLNVIAAAGASVKEVEHDRNFGPPDVAKVAVRVVMETRDAAHIREVHEAIRAAGILLQH